MVVEGLDALLELQVMRNAINEVQEDEKEICQKVHHAVMALDYGHRNSNLPEQHTKAPCASQGSRIEVGCSLDSQLPPQCEAEMISQ